MPSPQGLNGSHLNSASSCTPPHRWALTSETPGATATLKLNTQLGSASENDDATVQVRGQPKRHRVIAS